MQGPYARRVFPSMDEPEYKATYESTLWHQQSYPWSTSNDEYYPLSNMEPKGKASCSAGWCKTEFKKTVSMSTYITAFAVVDFGSVIHKSPVSNTDHDLYARVELIGEKDQPESSVNTDNPMWFPKECTGRSTDMLGEVLSHSYPNLGVQKADQIALPDFDAGAMENWGLVRVASSLSLFITVFKVTYREQSLLYDMNRDRFSRKSYVCTTVSHEMVHMWFGDYVTCRWWDELWLNEAFATYFAMVGLEESQTKELAWDSETGVPSWDLGIGFKISSIVYME